MWLTQGQKQKEYFQRVMIIGGKHTGKVGTIKAINTVHSSNPNTVQIAGEGEEFHTIEDYVIVIGADTPEIKLEGEVIE